MDKTMKYFVAGIMVAGLLSLAGLFVYQNKDGWGWCVAAVVFIAFSLFGEDDKPKN